MNVRDIDVLILDFDGTLADTRQCIIQCTNATLYDMGFDVVEEEQIVSCIGLPLREVFVRAGKVTDPSLVEACTERYRILFPDIASRSAMLFPHVKESMAELCKRGKRLTIATSRGRESLLPMIERFDIAPYISYIVAEEDVEKKKPHPDMVLRTLDDLRLRPEQVLVVGDTVFDIAMGQGARCRTCGVTYGNQSRSQLEKQKPDLIIDSFQQLVELIS